MLLFFCKSDYKWKFLLSGQENNVKTPTGQRIYSQIDFAVWLQDPGLTKQNQKECAGSRSGNPNAGNSNYFLGFKGKS